MIGFNGFKVQGSGLALGACYSLIGDERGGTSSTGSEGSEDSEGVVRRIKTGKRREYLWGDA